ncbi:MAG: hypothetical protein M0R23_09405 [Bacteroidales bacterium]|nr:hypothetical protein [Bacteroidales bacterium]
MASRKTLLLSIFARRNELFRVSEKDDLYFLSLFKEYSDTKKNITFQYQCSKNEELTRLRETYKFDEMRSAVNDFEMQKNLMTWVYKKLNKDGNCIPLFPMNSLNILDKTIKDNIGSNCWMHALVLNEIFLSLSMKSRMIRCMPMDLRYSDCHCVTLAFNETYNKWIIFDSACGCCYFDEINIPLNIMELRRRLINNEQILIPNKDEYFHKKMIKYWIKNCIRFESYLFSQFNCETIKQNKTIVNLNPKLYVIEDKIIKKNKYDLMYINTNNEEEFWR